MPAFLYILRCSDDSYYVGTTRGALEGRIGEHNAGHFGGYTAKRRPVTLVFHEEFDRITDAISGQRHGRMVKRMDFLNAVLLSPLASMWDNPSFLLEVVIGGLLTGVMYSLVALGFVLIYKASGVFNFAQGTMVLFAALTFVGLIERGAPVWAAFILAALVMVAMAFVIERLVLRPLVNQEQIILFMATIGLSFLLDG